MKSIEVGALGRPRGMVQGGRREEGSGWGTGVYLWRIHVDIWQNQYNIVKFKKKNAQHDLSLEKWKQNHSEILLYVYQNGSDENK